jgi:hypothetical protein
VLLPWNAAALPEIMTGALQESKRDVPERSTKAEQQASNRAALPEHAEVERQKPKRGLTLRLTGVPKARPS